VATGDHIRDGENGFLVGLGDVGDLVRRTRTLLDNPDFTRALGENVEQHLRRFGWESRCQRFQQVIARVLDQRRD